MSIASELTALNGYILGAYDEINDKGGTVPQNKNMANLATAIASISGGGGGGGDGITREVSAQGVYQMPAQSFTFSLPANATDVGARALCYAFRGCTSLTSVDLSSLTTVSGNNSFQDAFYECRAITSISFTSLTDVSGNGAFNYAFYRCTSLTNLSFPALTTSSFGSYTNQFVSMLSGIYGCTVHFPAAIQTEVASLSGYPSFGGSNTTVLFDL